jgi:hypothetical protein
VSLASALNWFATAVDARPPVFDLVSPSFHRFLKYECNASISWGADGSGNQVSGMIGVGPGLGVGDKPRLRHVCSAESADSVSSSSTDKAGQPCEVEILHECVYSVVLVCVVALGALAA